MIDALNLTKSYGSIAAVRDVSLTVAPAEIYALLGPNGAGKSTTIHMLTTLLTPDSGTVRINGHDTVQNPDAVRRIIGVTFQDLVLDRDLTGRECLDYAGRLYNLDRSLRRQRISEVLELVELGAAADRLTGTYSGGMKRRLELARCLMMHPLVLFLDEPTQGLDPQHRVQVWQYIKNLRTQNGMTVMLTTHAMDEAETLADTVGIIDNGLMVREGTPDALIGALGSAYIRVTAAFPAGYVPGFGTEAWVTMVDAQPGVLTIGAMHGARQMTTIIEHLTRDGIEIMDMSMTRPSLGDVFLQVTGRTLRDEGARQ
ncbi:MAG: ATP-binding cassette domain-containing protein [Chloroflexi bacterium]|nr:MAG: ATP-binding cassette domain-containing protein [Chloroflexota bacterium]RLT32571.1 MAG: ATP-binding cassette domain-containing protein [Chloroflexota bacterium]